MHDGQGTPAFLSRIESLRGLAALAVAVGHSMIWLTIGSNQTIWNEAITHVEGVQAVIARTIIAVCNGSAAVDIFFVMSGFVLARSLASSNMTASSLVGYVVKRVFRIYPAFLLSLVLVLVYLAAAFPGHAVMPGASVWFNGWYTQPVTSKEVADNVVLIAATLNPNAWTLRVEMLASLLLPVMVFVVWRAPLRWCLASLLALFVVSLSSSLGPSSTVHFLYMFFSGVVVARHGEVRVLTTNIWRAVVGVSIAMLLAAGSLFPLDHLWFPDALVVLGASGLVLAIANGADLSALKIMDSRAARYLGRISYSFYLLHFIVLYAIANVTLHVADPRIVARLPLPLMILACIVSIAITVALAALSYRYIERPMTHYGRMVFATKTRALRPA